MQVIYSGKTKASQPRDFKFPSGFCVTQNPKQWSNEIETLKLIDEIISPYVTKKREDLKLAKNQKALLIWDVFRGQMTDKVKERLTELNIEHVYVPANMTHFFSTSGPNSKWTCKAKNKERICYILFECCKATA